MSINVGYFFRESLNNFRRNWVMSLGAVITVFLSLLLVGVFLMTSVLVNQLVQDVEDKVTIQVFLKDGAATEDVDALQKEISGDPLVDAVNYTSKEEALAKFKEDMAKSPEIVAQLEGNPLPASLDVSLKDPQTVTQMVDKIKTSERFTKVADRPDNPEESLKYGQQVVDKLFSVTSLLRVIMVVFVIMLAIVSLIFMNNTIRIAIYARRKEIGIMRLVGASNWFIRTPFLLEGALQALLGAALAILSLVALQKWLLPKIGASVSWLALTIGSGDMTRISGALILAGLLIGFFGSSLAMRRYLRV